MDCLSFHCDLIVWKYKRLLATVGYDQTMSPLSPILAALLFKFPLYRHHFLIIFLWIVSHFLTDLSVPVFFPRLWSRNRHFAGEVGDPRQAA